MGTIHVFLFMPLQFRRPRRSSRDNLYPTKYKSHTLYCLSCQKCAGSPNMPVGLCPPPDLHPPRLILHAVTKCSISHNGLRPLVTTMHPSPPSLDSQSHHHMPFPLSFSGPTLPSWSAIARRRRRPVHKKAFQTKASSPPRHASLPSPSTP